VGTIIREAITHELIADLQGSIKALEQAKAGTPEDETEACAYCCETVIPAMEKLRSVVDDLEAIVADDLWPLPTYQEMLFVK